MTYFYGGKTYNIQMLKTERYQFYKVKEGQDLRQIADYFCVSEWLLAKENGLMNTVYPGQILKIPEVHGDVYVVKEGDTKELLCGSIENYERKNGTNTFYIGMRVIL